MTTNYRVGADLFLRDRASGPLRMFGGALNKIMGKAGPAGAAFKKMARDIAGASVAALAAKKILDSFNRSVERAKDLSSADIDLKISLMQTGEDPDVLLRKYKALRRQAFDVSKDVAGTQGDLERMYAAGMKMGFSPETMLGGLGRAGALLADATGHAKDDAIRMVGKYAAPFQATPEELTHYADLLAQATMTGAYETAAEVSHEMERAGPAMAMLGGTPEDAATWLAQTSSIKSHGAGQSIDAALRELIDPMKQGQLQALGLDKMISDKGELVPLSEMQRVLKKSFAGMTKVGSAAQIGSIFGTFGKNSIISLLTGKDVGAVRERMLGKPGVEAQRAERARTLEYQQQAAGGTWQTAWQNAFMPAERKMAGMTEWANKKFISPFAEKMANSDTLQTVTSAALPALAGTAGLAAMFFGGRALMHGTRGMRGFLGADPTAIMKAKALEKAAGVQPVSVVNFSDMNRYGGMMGGGAAGLGFNSAIPAAGGAGRLGKTLGTIGGGRYGMLAGAAGIGALAGVVAVGGAAIYGVGHHAAAAQNAVDRSGAKKDELSKKTGRGLYGVIAENTIAKGERAGWSEEKIQAEIQRSYASMSAKHETLYTGFFGNWTAGFKDLFGIGGDSAKKSNEAADKLAEAARLMQAAAISMSKVPPAKRRPEERS